jgi:hypothetical protein
MGPFDTRPSSSVLSRAQSMLLKYDDVEPSNSLTGNSRCLVRFEQLRHKSEKRLYYTCILIKAESG